MFGCDGDLASFLKRDQLPLNKNRRQEREQCIALRFAVHSQVMPSPKFWGIRLRE
jgi:hypothetical protein